MKRPIFFLLGFSLLTFWISSCSPSEAHNRGYVISKSHLEDESADPLNQ